VLFLRQLAGQEHGRTIPLADIHERILENFSRCHFEFGQHV